MANYVHLGNNIFVGITTDTKPTAANTAQGALLFEFATDYSKYTMYVNDQTSWKAQTAFTETYTNKTLTTPIISSISNTGTITLPTSTDTLVGRATTDTLTNKSFDAKTNTVTSMEVHPSKKRTGSYMGGGNSGTSAGASLQCSGLLEGMSTSIAVAGGAFSQSLRTVSSGGLRGVWVSSTTINSIGGTRFTSSNMILERDLNFMVEAKLASRTATTTERIFFGVISSNATPASLASPLDALSGVAFFYDSAVDGNWHIHQNDGTATAQTSAIANVAAAGTTPHTFGLRAVESGPKFQYQYDNGTWTDIPTTQIPAATTGLGIMWYIESLAGSAARALDVFWCWCECDP